MKKYNYFLIFGVLLSCTTTSKMLVSDRSPSYIKKLDYFEPITLIHLIKEKNKSQASDSLSILTKYQVDSILSTRSRFKIGKQLQAEEKDYEKQNLNRELIAMTNYAIQQNSVKGMDISETVKTVMEKNGSDFALTVVVNGFTRAEGNYGKQVGKGIGVGLLTLGLYTPVPIRANSTVHFLICDKQKNNIALYRRSFVEKDPINPVVLSEQIDNVLTEYFFNSLSSSK